MPGFKDGAVKFIASGFYVSHIPAAITGFKKFTGSGLFGSLLGLLFVPFLPSSPAALAAFLAAFFVFAVWVSSEAEKAYGSHDDPRIVIDEILGVWISMALLPKTAFNVFCAFALFRALDTAKPWPIGAIDRKTGGGFAIMVDDVIAAAAANLLVRALNLLI